MTPSGRGIGRLLQGLPREGPHGRRPDPSGEEPRVSQLIARLVIVTHAGDERAAARILDQLIETRRGAWLVRQACAAGMRKAAKELAWDVDQGG
jgi:hypothetical protein